MASLWPVYVCGGEGCGGGVCMYVYVILFRLGGGWLGMASFDLILILMILSPSRNTYEGLVLGKPVYGSVGTSLVSNILLSPTEKKGGGKSPQIEQGEMPLKGKNVKPLAKGMTSYPKCLKYINKGAGITGHLSSCLYPSKACCPMNSCSQKDL